MGRPGYVSFYADERTQRIFDEFTAIKGITKSTALTEMMDIYMLAQDQELYQELIKKSLNVDYAKDVILQREDTTQNNDFIFMKLGTSFTSTGEELDGQQTIEAYERSLQHYDFTWFSTMSLHSGMAKKKVEYYNNRIRQGEEVKVFLALGMGINEISHSAVVREIVSSRDAIECPGGAGEAATIPVEYGPNEKAKIWLKLTDLKPETTIKANMLKFRGTGKNVKEVITKSQFHFGYVCFDTVDVEQ